MEAMMMDLGQIFLMFIGLNTTIFFAAMCVRAGWMFGGWLVSR
jgi:hypothetical protein